MYSWNYDPNYVIITMGTNQEEKKKFKVKFPSKYEPVVFTPTDEEDREAVELAYALSLPRTRDASDASLDLRNTTHSLKRQLRIAWCKKALVVLGVALLMAAAVTVPLILVLGKESSLAQGINSTVPTTKIYRECTSTQFACSRGECIPVRWRCDDRVDCWNAADERNCARHADNSTATSHRSCQAWAAEFRTKCPPPGCPFYPNCSPADHWNPVQCTVDNSSCWCVDWATGATVPGSFVKDVDKNGRPFCEMKPA